MILLLLMIITIKLFIIFYQLKIRSDVFIVQYRLNF